MIKKISPQTSMRKIQIMGVILAGLVIFYSSKFGFVLPSDDMQRAIVGIIVGLSFSIIYSLRIHKKLLESPEPRL